MGSSGNDSKPDWLLVHCTRCGNPAKCDPVAVQQPACPNCGEELFLPDPNELVDDTGDLVEESRSARLAKTGKVMLTASERTRAVAAPIDSEKLQSTTAEHLYSEADKLVRLKRKSERVEKELVGWDDRGEEGKSGTSKWTAAKLTTIAAIGLSVAALVTYLVISSTKEKEWVAPEREKTAAELARDSLPKLERDSLNREPSKELYAQARRVATFFLNAESYEERLELVRDPEKVRPRMEEYYSEHQDGSIEHRPIPEKGKVRIHGSLLMFQVELPDFSVRPLAMEEVDGRFLVDWESFVGWSDVAWDELDARRPSEPFLLRARIKRGNYYNYGYRDDQWISWQLEDGGRERRIFGYTRKDDPEPLTLVSFLKNNRGPVFMTLKVRFPEDAPAGDQVEILDIVANGWVVQNQE